MKRIFLLKGLDCPNCSAKIEKKSENWMEYNPQL